MGSSSASSSTSYWGNAEQESERRSRGLTREDAIVLNDDDDEEEEEGSHLSPSELMQMQPPGRPPLAGWPDTRIAALALPAPPSSEVTAADPAIAQEYQQALAEILRQHPPDVSFRESRGPHPAAPMNTYYNPHALPAWTRPPPPAPPTPRIAVSQRAFVFDRIGGRLAKVGKVTVRMRGRFLWAGARAAEQAHWQTYSTSWGLDHSMAVVGVEMELNDLYRVVNSKEELVVPDCMTRLRDSATNFHSRSALYVNPFSRWICLPLRDLDAFSRRHGSRNVLNLYRPLGYTGPCPLPPTPPPQHDGSTSRVHITIFDASAAGEPAAGASSSRPASAAAGTVLPPAPLPNDLLRNIQARLPLKKLFQSLVVSKEWHQAMWAPDFRGMQRQFGPKDHLLLEFSFDYSVEVFDSAADPVPSRREVYSLDSSVAHGLTSAYSPGQRSHGLTKARFLRRPAWHQLTFLIPTGMRAVGHSKGLLCLMEASVIYLRENIPADLLPPVDHRLLMCDPLSNVKKWIAHPHVHPGCKHQEDFQLVGMVTHTNSAHYQLYAIYTGGPAQVYESVTDEWTITQAYVGAHCPPEENGREEFGFGTVCSGALYVLGRCVDRRGFCLQHGILRCHVLGCSRRSHSYSIYTNDLSPGARWERWDLDLPEGFNQACHALIEDQFGRLLMLSNMTDGGPAACIWNVDLATFQLRTVARLEYQMLTDWGFLIFVPEMWFPASDGLIYITLNNLPQLLVVDLRGFTVEWWWMPPSPLNLLYRGLQGRYAAMPVCPRMDAFLPKLRPTVTPTWLPR